MDDRKTGRNNHRNEGEGEGLPDLTQAPPLLPSSIQASGEEGQKPADMPGNYHLLSESKQALAALNNAPSINSLPSGYNQQNNIENVSVPSNGSRDLSTATALLCQSLDSGSLTGNLPKDGQNQLNVMSNTDTASAALMSTEIYNITHSSVGTGTSSEDNSKQAMCIQLDRKSGPESEPASSYMEMTARTNINERLADFNSITTIAAKKAALNPAPNNNLDQSMQGAGRPANKTALPKNITGQYQSLSLNRDESMTEPKLVSSKSTQTDSAVQDQDRYGGAAAAAPDQSMSSGPASSLPSDEVLVRKLKRPIIQWLQRKLETNIGMAWQDLADLHDWDYERITGFESACAGKSPFCQLLAEPEFQMYRIGDLKQDLEQLPRKDILYDLDGVMKRHYR